MTTVTLTRRETAAVSLRLQWRGSHDALVWSRWYDLTSPEQKVPGFDRDGDYKFCQARVVENGTEAGRSPIETWSTGS
jgi:hypothetical protein